jgi:hypothetical protein
MPRRGDGSRARPTRPNMIAASSRTSVAPSWSRRSSTLSYRSTTTASPTCCAYTRVVVG